METDELNERLRQLSGEEILAIAASVRRDMVTADGELAWWRATIAVGATLKRHHRTREASLAAHRAASALLDAAQRAGLGEDVRDDVTIAARTASEAARAVVAAAATPTGRDPHPALGACSSLGLTAA